MSTVAMAGRRNIIPTSHKDYCQVIRLEGQIDNAIEIWSFLDQYDPIKSDTDAILRRAVESYFGAIRSLQTNFFNCGIDLARGTSNLGGFVAMMNEMFFARLPGDLLEADFLWPRILWLQNLQCVLENENLSIEESLIEGWRMFLDPEQGPTKHNLCYNIAEQSSSWHGLAADEQEEFLKCFAINADMVHGLPGRLQMPDLTDPRARKAEELGVFREFALSRKVKCLDVNHPSVTAPTSEVSICSICHEDLVKEEIGSSASHRPVETSCHHVFGYSCIRNWFSEGQQTCPMCREQFTSVHECTLEELLQSCDRALEWMDPCNQFEVRPRPHSFLDKLSLLFRPASEIREKVQAPTRRELEKEKEKLVIYGLFLTRDRLQAVVENDADRFRQVVERQAQVFARRVWINFINGTRPDYY